MMIKATFLKKILKNKPIKKKKEKNSNQTKSGQIESKNLQIKPKDNKFKWYLNLDNSQTIYKLINKLIWLTNKQNKPYFQILKKLTRNTHTHILYLEKK